VSSSGPSSSSAGETQATSTSTSTSTSTIRRQVAEGDDGSGGSTCQSSDLATDRPNGFYPLGCAVDGVWILSSGPKGAEAVLRAGELVARFRDANPSAHQALAESGVRIIVAAEPDTIFDLPETKELQRLQPDTDWSNIRAYFGGPAAPFVVLTAADATACSSVDTASPLLHEFGHAVASEGILPLDDDFLPGISDAYETATSQGLWEGTYSATHMNEYWAEGFAIYVQDGGGPLVAPDRAGLLAYDPTLYRILDKHLAGVGVVDLCES
jgi:hypothetical protein